MNKILAIILFLLIKLCIVTNAYSVENKPMSETVFESVLTRLESGESFSTREMLEYRAEPDGISSIISLLRKLTLNQRVNAVPFASDLGRIMIPAESVFPERPGPVITEPLVIKYLVDQLDAREKEIRNPACIALAALVPEKFLQQYQEVIIPALLEYPGTDGAIILLGKIDSPKSIELLNKPEIRAASADDTEMALARLGDRKAEQSIIDSYNQSDSVQLKAQLACRLGYIGSKKAIELLAKKIRTPDYYEWHPPAIRSLRLHIIEGLHLAYMEEEIFWQPLISPEDDSYYENIENWLKKKLNISWEVEPPDFLYQIESPIMPPSS